MYNNLKSPKDIIINSQTKSEKYEQSVYFISQLLGMGAYGSVYLAIDQQTTKDVAIKYQQNMLPDELEFLMKLKQHKFKNAINIHDVFKEYPDGFYSPYFIVMDIAKQGTLLNRIQQAKDNPITESEMSNIFRQVANGLRELHEVGIIHRDIKPENIVICQEDNELIYRICDFGEAKMHGGDQAPLTMNVGTPYYMAPELLDNDQYNLAVDVWSLGAVFYELYAHEPLFQGYNSNQIYENIRTFDFQQSIDKHVTNQVHNRIIKSMLNRNPNERKKINDVVAELSQNIAALQDPVNDRKKQAIIKPMNDKDNFDQRKEQPEFKKMRNKMELQKIYQKKDLIDQIVAAKADGQPNEVIVDMILRHYVLD